MIAGENTALLLHLYTCRREFVQLPIKKRNSEHVESFWSLRGTSTASRRIAGEQNVPQGFFFKRLSPSKQWAAFSLVQVHVYLITVKVANRLPLCCTKLLIFTVHSVEFPPALYEGLSVKGDWNCFQHRSCTVVTMVQNNPHAHKSPGTQITVKVAICNVFTVPHELPAGPKQPPQSLFFSFLVFYKAWQSERREAKYRPYVLLTMELALTYTLTVLKKRWEKLEWNTAESSILGQTLKWVLLFLQS